MTDDKKAPRIKTKPGQLPINQETLDIIVANIIPTSKYFESRFDYLEHRVIKIEEEIKDFRLNTDRQFEQMKTGTDRQFEQMKAGTDRQFERMKSGTDKQFEQVDRQLEQIKAGTDRQFELMKAGTDKRFEQVISSIDRLTDKLENRDKDHRSFTMRMFSISIVISFLGVLGVFLKMFKMV